MKELKKLEKSRFINDPVTGKTVLKTELPVIEFKRLQKSVVQSEPAYTRDDTQAAKKFKDEMMKQSDPAYGVLRSLTKLQDSELDEDQQLYQLLMKLLKSMSNVDI